MLTKEDLLARAETFAASAPCNFISESQAITPSCVGLRLYDAPLLGVADAEDPLFLQMKNKDAVGPQFLLPQKWLEGAVSVVSFFLPFSEAVRRSNAAKDDVPSSGWLHARVEGQLFIEQLSRYLAEQLTAEGCRAVIPSYDPRFGAVEFNDGSRSGLWSEASFTSNWSERHAAYIAGLGTFGLSRGFITKKGVAGRFGSIITDARIPITPRLYAGLYDYCTHCGACVKRCPVQAISPESGKDHRICATFLTETRARYAPRYGCGKCQVLVPCEAGIPQK